MSTNCELLELTRAGDGRKVNVALATHLPFEDPLVSGGAHRSRHVYGKHGDMLRYDTSTSSSPRRAWDGQDQHWPGEVVDGGMLVLFDVFQPLFTPYVGKSNMFAIVRPRHGSPKVGIASCGKRFRLSEAKDDLSHLLREAEKQDIVITRHGKPAGVLIGFKSEDDWFEYRLLKAIRASCVGCESARKSCACGQGHPARGPLSGSEVARPGSRHPQRETGP